MERLRIVLVAAVLAVAIPSTGRASVPTAPCGESSDYTGVGLTGAHEDVTPKSMPSVPYAIMNGDDHAYQEESVVHFRYRIDLSGSPTKPFAQTGDVRIALTWDSPSDYDLLVYDANGEFLASGGGFTPLVEAREAVFLPQVAHCADLRVDVLNYLGLPPNGMALDTTLAGLE